jgi:hypothetical protein
MPFHSSRSRCRNLSSAWARRAQVVLEAPFHLRRVVVEAGVVLHDEDEPHLRVKHPRPVARRGQRRLRRRGEIVGDEDAARSVRGGGLAPDDEHGTRHRTQDLLGEAPEEEALDAGEAVGRRHEQADLLLRDRIAKGIHQLAANDGGSRTEPGEARIVRGELLEALLDVREQVLGRK